MFNSKKRDRPFNEKVSPPHKMTKNQQQQPESQPSNSDLMAQLTQLVSSNSEMMQKIDQLETRFGLMEKLFEEVETLKKEVDRLSRQSKSYDGFKRFEVEQKKEINSSERTPQPNE